MKVVNNINKNIFRSYDIRGVYPSDLNEDVSYTIGKSFGTTIKRLGKSECVVGYDNRYSSKELSNALIAGITSTGIDVVNIGLVTTPMYYYACIKFNIASGVMVTASHNPKDDNGFKFAFDERGNAKGEMIEEFYNFTIKNEFDNGEGVISFADVKEDYYKTLLSSVNIENKDLKVILDCGNGTTSFFAPELYSLTGIIPTVLYGKSDPSFPNHHPDPCVEDNLKVLKDTVKAFKADIGIAFDGDGDRVGIVDEKGRYIPTDKYMILIIRDIIKNTDNKRFLYDVKCSRSLSDEITKLGGYQECYRSGNSYTKARMVEGNFIFGGEYSGHVFFRDKFLGFDSGMYAGLRILEILSKTNKKVSELLEGITEYYSTEEIKIECSDDKKFKVIEKIKDYSRSLGVDIIDIDGVRIEFSNGWALIRASNTGPNITLRFEATTIEERDKLKQTFIEFVNKFIDE